MSISELLSELLGQKYNFNFIIILLAVIEIFTCTILINVKAKKRKYFALRVVISALIMAALAFPIAYLRMILNDFSPVLKSVFVNLYEIVLIGGLVAFNFDHSLYSLFLNVSKTWVIKSLFGYAIAIMYFIFGVDSTSSITLIPSAPTIVNELIYIFLHVSVYLIFGLFYKVKDDLYLTEKIKRRSVILTISSFAVTASLFALLNIFENENQILSIICKVFAVFICIIMLFLISGFFETSQKEYENVLTQNLLEKEKEQFSSMRENVNSINSMCHDIRHELHKIQDKISDTELEKLNEAIKMYDQTIRTGNDILDGVIYEMQLASKQYDAEISVMADGLLLNFMDKTKLYSLMKNAFSNALEAIKNLEDKSKRIISLSIVKEKGLTIIEMVNYFDGDLRLNNENLPISTSTDNSFSHGYGTRSIKYIADEYGGSCEFKKEDDLFILRISFIN